MSYSAILWVEGSILGVFEVPSTNETRSVELMKKHIKIMKLKNIPDFMAFVMPIF